MVRKKWLGSLFSVALLVLVASGSACSDSRPEDSSATQPAESVDTWAYSSAEDAWAKLKITGPGPVVFDYAVYDSDTGKVILFPQDFETTWTYGPVAKAWSEVHPTGVVPPERSNGSIAYDPLTDRVVLVGGWYGSSPIDEGTTFNDTWLYDLPVVNVWSEAHPVRRAAGSGVVGQDDLRLQRRQADPV